MTYNVFSGTLNPTHSLTHSPYSIGLLSCLSVTLMYCGQTVGRIKMKLGMQVGLGHTVLDGDPAPRLQKEGRVHSRIRDP